jgi:uncharacterized membrane protein
MSIGMIAFWALVIYAIVWFARGRPSEQQDRPRERPEEILKRRLAHGEITLDEYEELRSVLESDKHPSLPPPGSPAPTATR